MCKFFLQDAYPFVDTLKRCFPKCYSNIAITVASGENTTILYKKHMNGNMSIANLDCHRVDDVAWQSCSLPFPVGERYT